MVNDLMKKCIQEIQETPYREEQLVKALRGFVDLFPSVKASLFNYSALNEMVEGVIQINENGLQPIPEIRESIRNMPMVFAAVRNRKAMYVEGLELKRQMPAKYVADATNFMVVPISYNSTVIGYFASLYPYGRITVNENFLQTLTLYGKLVGKVFITVGYEGNSKLISKRETEVLQRISWGESMKQMAESMGISEFTVQDYVKSALKKLNARHRAHGVAEAIRLGYIK